MRVHARSSRFPMNFRHVPLALFLLMLLPGAALARKPAHGEAAAFFARHDAELEFRGGDVTTLSFGRYGIEYREDVVRFLQMSIAFGYSENDADHPAALARERSEERRVGTEGSSRWQPE